MVTPECVRLHSIHLLKREGSRLDEDGTGRSTDLVKGRRLSGYDHLGFTRGEFCKEFDHVSVHIQ